MTTSVEVRDHCAKFSAPVLAAVRTVLADLCPPTALWPTRVLDPFAGVGGVHELRRWGWETVGVELEPEWAAASPHTQVGDATQLPFPDGSFDAIVTSPTYGNRMADQYDGSGDRCTVCKGQPWQPEMGPEGCTSCGATGLVPSKRYTYRIYLGRPLTDGNTAALQWGPAYRSLHHRAWVEAVRVLRSGGVFVLNISDHYRQGLLQGVDLWHAATLARLGLDLVRQVPIDTARNGNGANRDLRDSCEWLLVFQRLDS